MRSYRMNLNTSKLVMEITMPRYSTTFLVLYSNGVSIESSQFCGILPYILNTTGISFAFLVIAKLFFIPFHVSSDGCFYGALLYVLGIMYLRPLLVWLID